MYRYLMPAFAALSMVAAIPCAAMAQPLAARSSRTQGIQATNDMRSRLAAAVERVWVTEQHGKLTPARAASLRQKLVRAERDLTRLSQRRGIVREAQLATYGRMVEATDAELGVAATGSAYQNDALPSAEVIAFKKTDARLRYGNARIEYDTRECAIYQGVARDGRTRQVPLLDPSGRPICARR